MTVRVRALAAAAAGLLVVGVALPAAGTAAPALPGPAAAPAAAAVPLLTFDIAKGGTVAGGDWRQPAGPLRIKMTATGAARTMTVIRLKPGYTLAEARQDTKALRTKRYSSFVDYRWMAEEGDDKIFDALRNYQRNVISYGGVDAMKGKSATMTLTLKAPGTYYVTDGVGSFIGRTHPLVITSDAGAATVKAPAVTVRMTAAHEFDGPDVLPAKGTIRVKNTGTKLAHWYSLALQHVNDDANEGDVVEYYGGEGTETRMAQPLPGAVATSVLSPGRTQDLTYDLPPGTYAMICLFPNTGNHGPWWDYGLLKMVTLK